MRPTPHEVFENPADHWAFLTAPKDTDFEGQYFDRKAAGRLAPGAAAFNSREMNQVMDQVREVSAAFANAHKQGGLLVVGIAKTGEIKGIDHLNDEQRSRLTDIGVLLRHQAVQTKFVNCHDPAGTPRTICLFLGPSPHQAICETLENSPRAWERTGAQNLIVNQSRREQLQRDKRVVDFEQMYCGPFARDDLDLGIVEEVCKARLDGVDTDGENERLLYQTGAITKDGRGSARFFTKAGFLFFAANPQRLLPKAYIRLLGFESLLSEAHGLPPLDKTFAGPIAKQIKDLRVCIRESGFFKTYQRRAPGGGLREAPEFPFIAVDEAIVNAVAHRDYAVNRPIECEYYRDAFVVKNHGRILQRHHDGPDHFSLATVERDHQPRTARLTEWLRDLRGPHGAPFIHALAEGTKRMRQEMEKLGLPAPEYDVNPGETQVTLYRVAPEREAALQRDLFGEEAGATNLFPLAFLSEDGLSISYQDIRLRKKDILSALRSKLQAQDWFIDSQRFGRIVAHRRASAIALPESVTALLRLYPAYAMSLRAHFGQYYLCLDYELVVKNVRTVQKVLAAIPDTELVHRRAVAQVDQEWLAVRLVAVGPEWSVVHLYDLDEERPVANTKIIPELSRSTLKHLLQQHRRYFDLDREMKRHRLASERNASRMRFDYTRYPAQEMSNTVFPLTLPGILVTMSPQPSLLYRGASSGRGFQLRGLREPFVAFA